MSANLSRILSTHWPAALPVVALVALSAAMFPSAGRDDAYITYWAAHALREFGEVVNLNGDRVEQSTSLLHVFLLAGASLISKASIPSLGPPLSALFGALAVAYTWAFALRYVGRWHALGAALIVGSAAPFAYWAMGGLESTLAALAAIALLYHISDHLERDDGGRPPAPLLISMGAFLLVRPESIFVVASILVGAFVVLRLRANSVADERLESYALTLRKLLWAALAAAAMMAAIFVVKTAYFGDWLPLPVAAKVGGGALLSRTGEGLEYLINALLPPPFSLLPFFSIAGGVIVARRLMRDEPEFIGGLLLALYAFASVAFILIVGGDWMEGSRYIAPVIPALAILAVIVAPLIKAPDIQIYAVGGIIAFHLVGAVWFAKFGSVTTPFWDVASAQTLPASIERHSWFARPNRTHLRDVPVADELNDVIERLLPIIGANDAANRGEPAPRLTIMSGQAGFVIYNAALRHYGSLEFIDRRAVSTPHFTECGVTRGGPRDSTGLLFTYTAFFANSEEINSRCSIEKPHVVFDLDVPERVVEAAVTRGGYVVVYRQQGKIQTSATLQGIEILANEFIAVRGDLAAHFPEALPKSRTWNEP